MADKKRKARSRKGSPPPQQAGEGLPEMLPQQLSPAWRNLYLAVAREIRQMNWPQNENNKSD
ncbi:MAG TPA: hypothetical protein VHS59_14490 [Bacillota bacterium]|nr:hypothetical protein [Bacillota bacterium]